MEITINNKIYKQAQEYAQQRGMNLSTIIENYLLRFIGKNDSTPDDETIPDVVLSLLGAAEATDPDDMNGRASYYKYLEEKYQ